MPAQAGIQAYPIQPPIERWIPACAGMTGIQSENFPTAHSTNQKELSMAIIRKKLATFAKGGVHPADNKQKTKDLPVEKMPEPDQVTLFLTQHIGVPCEVPFFNVNEKLFSRDYFLENNICGD